MSKSKIKDILKMIDGNYGHEADDELLGEIIKGKKEYGENFEKEFWKEFNNMKSKDKMIEDLQKENEMLKKELEKYKSSEPPYTMSKLLDGLHIDSYQYVDDEICEKLKDDIKENYSEDEELIINI